MTKTTYTIDGVPGYETVPNYLEKGGFMRPVIPANFIIETVETEIPDPVESPEVTEFKTMLSDYVAEMNTKYPTLGLLITDSVLVAAQKIEATDMTKTEAMYLDMLRRNLTDAQNNHQFYQAR